MSWGVIGPFSAKLAGHRKAGSPYASRTSGRCPANSGSRRRPGDGDLQWLLLLPDEVRGQIIYTFQTLRQKSAAHAAVCDRALMLTVASQRHAGALVQRFPGSRLPPVTPVSGVIYANMERIEKKPIRG